MTITIRPMKATDEAAWRRLWAGYLAFYRVEVPDQVTASTWARLNDRESSFCGTSANIDGCMVGFAISMKQESSWSDRSSLYLEDLFVDERARGLGVGAALIRHLRDRCLAEGYSRLTWHTDRDNRRARKLYDRFSHADDVVRYRLTFG